MNDKPEVWGILELLGHLRLAGRVTEEERFGAKLGRIDIPKSRDQSCPNCTDASAAESPCPVCGAGTFITQFFSGASIYRLTIVSEEVARHAARKTAPDPVQPWDFPKALTHAESTVRHPDTGMGREDDEVDF